MESPAEQVRVCRFDSRITYMFQHFALLSRLILSTISSCCNNSYVSVKIITGSLQGNLRIHMPRERDYKPEDLLLEVELDQAILQLALGKFSG